VASEIEEVPAGTTAEPAGGRDRPGRRGRWLARLQPWMLAELLALSGFVVAQPLLDVAGKSPDFFLFRGADRGDILLLVAGVTLLPAVAVWILEVLVGLVSELVRRFLQLATLTALFMLLTIEVAKQLTAVRGPRLLAIASAAGLLAGVLYARQSWLKVWLRYLGPAPVVFAVLFLTVSPVSRLVLPARAEPSAAQASVVQAGDRAPVVLIFFDEFPLASLLDSKARIDRRVYPNFARFAEQSTWYRNATGVSGFTPWAMPAMLTGRYPAKVKAPVFSEYPDNLFMLFGRSHDLKVYETISQLCPPSLCKATAGSGGQGGLRAVVGDAVRVFREIVSPDDAAVDPGSFVDLAAGQATPLGGTQLPPTFRFDQVGLNQPARFDDFLRGLQQSDRPTLHFLHVLLPHQPWRYLPSGVEYTFRSFGRAFPNGEMPAPVLELAHERHLLQLAYTDRLVGQVIARLKAEGLYDKSLVLMTADHGFGWTPGEETRTLMARNAPTLMWVPLFIKAPNQREGRVDDRNWEQVDLLPTLADMLRVRVPWRMDGRSQVGPPARQRSEKWWFDLPGHREVADGPSNWGTVLAGETDRLARAGEGVDGLYRFGAFADLVYRDPASVGPIGGVPASAKVDNWKLYRWIDPSSG
jgi:hypothetical protein